MRDWIRLTGRRWSFFKVTTQVPAGMGRDSGDEFESDESASGEAQKLAGIEAGPWSFRRWVMASLKCRAWKREPPTPGHSMTCVRPAPLP
jgi:hypothetical protein